MSHVPYSSAVGSIMYAMVCTCPDISQAVSVVSPWQGSLAGSEIDTPLFTGHYKCWFSL
jgi:hypothetical protein